MVRLVLPLLTLAVLGFALASAVDTMYTTKFDNVNIDDVLKNERLLKRAFACLMDEGACTPDVAELKKALPDALQTECSKCSEKQKEGSKKVLKFLYEQKKDEFSKLEKKYDPEGLYRKKYKDLAEKEGYKV